MTCKARGHTCTLLCERGLATYIDLIVYRKLAMAQIEYTQRFPLPLVPANLKIGREIDRGAWATVHEGELAGELVAVKKIHRLLKEAGDGDNVVDKFFQECERLMDLDHPNVVSE